MGRSVGSELRLLIVLLVVLIPLGTVVSLVAISAQGSTIRSLTQVLGPAVEADNAVLLEMTRARTAWLVAGSAAAASGGGTLAAHHAAVDRMQGQVDAAVALPVIGPEERAAYAGLAAAQRRAIQAWFSRAERSGSPPPGADDGTESAWQDFTAANAALSDRLREARGIGRVQSREALTTLSLIVVAVAVVACLALLFGGLRLRSSVVRPLAQLSAVVRRHARGDSAVLADPEHGATEVRTLARDFNDLSRANAGLSADQRSELRMRQLVIEVARGVRDADDVPAALDGVCRDLGKGLDADRVLLYTVDDDSGAVLERSQWHRDRLPDLLPLPPSLGQLVRDIAEQLRIEGGSFALADLFDEEWADDPRVVGFRRSTGARSLVLAPIGSAEHGVGLLALLTLDRPRVWLRYETRAVEQSAAIAGQAVVKLRLAELRDEQLRRLTEIDHQKTDFLATVSHELRTPLTSIAGYLELLEDGDFGPLADGQRRALTIVQRNTARLRGLIDNLLVLNKIESAGLAPSLERVPVGDLVGCLVETLEPAAAAAGVDILVDPLPSGVELHVDRGQFDRVLLNLGSNAVKFTPRGGTVTVTVTVTREDSGATDPAGDLVLMTVRDTGIGIPAADVARLSERFFRAGNAAAAAIPGTGLGLAIVRSIVEGHGGRLRIDSVEHVGTSVTVEVPAA